MMQTQDEVYYLHWIAFWKHLASACLLFALGVVALGFSVRAGLGLLGAALVYLGGIYYARQWHTLQFVGENRLLRTRGCLGKKSDLVSLFGRISPSQVPILGDIFDVGRVHLGVPGPDIHIGPIANFHAFVNRLTYGAARRAMDTQMEAQGRTTIQLVFVNGRTEPFTGQLLAPGSEEWIVPGEPAAEWAVHDAEPWDSQGAWR